MLLYYHHASLVLVLIFIRFFLEHAPFQLICASQKHEDIRYILKIVPVLSEFSFFFFSYGSIFSAVFGPKLGMRAMVQCRFSWGYVQIDILFETSLLRFSNLTSTLLFKITDTHIGTMLLHSQVF